MNDYQKIKNAGIGQVVTLYREFDYTPDPVEYFSKLTEFGQKKNCILLESADITAKYGERSIGIADPCLKLTGQGIKFEIKSLNPLGEILLNKIKDDLVFCNEVKYDRSLITGTLYPERKSVDESERLHIKTHADIMRKIVFKFKPVEKEFIPYAGLFGVIGYDFIDQFEDLPKNTDDLLQDSDYELYFVDNLFLMEHKKGKTYFIANAFITDRDRDEIYVECIKKLAKYEECLEAKLSPCKWSQSTNKPKLDFYSDTSKTEFVDKVKQLKQHILSGDIFQAVLSRMIMVECNLPPLSIYKELRNLNPSPYMFYMNNELGSLLGSSPETFLKVEGDNEKIVEIRPIAGTKPRGIIDGKIDYDLDSRYETELKIDRKELAEHTMLIDLARNDVARISKPGTRFVGEPFVVEKYSHVQHLVSNVRGILKDNLDALHAYLASMNMGTLTGAPKVEAMKLLRQYEKNKRGFYGGSVGYLTPSGDFDSCIVIRSIRIKNNKAYIRAGAGIVYDSIPENEFEETEKKASACLKAIELAAEEVK
jgi:anthranilate synthase component 1